MFIQTLHVTDTCNQQLSSLVIQLQNKGKFCEHYFFDTLVLIMFFFKNPDREKIVQIIIQDYDWFSSFITKFRFCSISLAQQDNRIVLTFQFFKHGMQG